VQIDDLSILAEEISRIQIAAKRSIALGKSANDVVVA
jgi:hypothetical protein